MDNPLQVLIDAVILAIILAGIWRFRNPRAAGSGNLIVGVALFCALGIEIFRSPAQAAWLAALALVAGSLGGLSVARRVNMTQIPATIGFQNGAGGLASCLVSFVELSREGAAISLIGQTAGVFGLVVGAVTFSGSMVASGKLAGMMRQAPLAIRGHRGMLVAGLAVALAFGYGLAAASGSTRIWLAAATVLASLLCGVLFSIRVGGADMPVLISLLNAWSGVSAGFCGVVVRSQVLTACGATVAASGLILTYAMCRAMNRSLPAVLLGGTYAPPSGPRETADEQPQAGLSRPQQEAQAAGGEPFSRAAELIEAAATVIVIPGYGMALAHAQRATVQLANRIRQMGKDVKFAIHPLAGRMPGHMHVLLAEAEIDPDMLFDLDEVNGEFAGTDLAVVVGACDVVNPAASSVPGTPISGMPILDAQRARAVLVCNLDDRPGYSGVDNPLYHDPKTVLLLGDAAATLSRLLEASRPSS